ncbi:MAG: hypothetical protein ACRDL7_02220, partial [Gaiellaceae bacterium]
VGASQDIRFIYNTLRTIGTEAPDRIVQGKKKKRNCLKCAFRGRALIPKIFKFAIHKVHTIAVNTPSTLNAILSTSLALKFL